MRMRNYFLFGIIFSGFLFTVVHAMVIDDHPKTEIQIIGQLCTELKYAILTENIAMIDTLLNTSIKPPIYRTHLSFLEHAMNTFRGYRFPLSVAVLNAKLVAAAYILGRMDQFVAHELRHNIGSTVTVDRQQLVDEALSFATTALEDKPALPIMTMLLTAGANPISLALGNKKDTIFQRTVIECLPAKMLLFLDQAYIPLDAIVMAHDYATRHNVTPMVCALEKSLKQALAQEDDCEYPTGILAKKRRRSPRSLFHVRVPSFYLQSSDQEKK